MNGLDTFRHLARRMLSYLGVAGLAVLAASSSVEARSDFAPYLEVQQVLTSDFNGEVLTYTSVAAGVDGRIETRRVQAQIAYRYEHRISWEDNIVDDSTHSGIAQLRYVAVPDMLSLDAGALAARTYIDGTGPVFGTFDPNNPFVAEVYSGYAGPTLSTKVGRLSVGASYRLGYVIVNDREIVVPGQPAIDRFDKSLSHTASASVGMSPGPLPFGWTGGAGYVREDTNQLDHEMEGKYVRGDIVVPVSHSLAVTGGIGYEDIQSSQQDFVRDANGLPVISPDGELIPDLAKPRLLTYDQSGLIWDAGIIYRPNRRTELQARVGGRYGGTTVTASLRHSFNPDWAISANIYDAYTSYGLVIINNLNNLPTSFNTNHNPLTGGFGSIGGCVFGTEPGTGTCFNGALQSPDSANFRNRGGNVLLSGQRGGWGVGVGAGYAHRRYTAPVFGLGGVGLTGITDETFFVSGGVTRSLGTRAGVNLDAFASWYDSDRPNVDSAFSTGATASYYRSMLVDQLQGYIAGGVYLTEVGDESDTVGTGLVGLRYTF